MRIKALFPLTLLLALGALSLVGCSGNEGDPVPVIGSNTQYAEVLTDAQKLSQASFEKLNLDQPLTPEDRKNLSKAATKFEALQAYEPQRFAPYLALGMIYRGLNEPEVATKALKMCLDHIPPSKDPDFIATSGEAHYQLSRALFDLGQYELSLAEASTAIQTVPDNPNYLTARAAAYLQLKRVDEGKKDLQAALKLDPEHRRAKALMKLLS